MKQSMFGRIITLGTACAVITTCFGVAPANALTDAPSRRESSAPTPDAVLSEIRTDLLAAGATADIAAFDQLNEDQRQELASYFLDPAVASAVTANSTARALGTMTVRTSGDFEWGEGTTGAADPGSGAGAARAASRSSWGTQWFSFAGIRLTETKVSMSYEYSETTARKMLGYSCTVVRNIQPFTQVTTSKSSGYISGGQATAKCKVVVKRGVPTPWGTIAWSTYSAIQRLSAKGNGAVTYNRWE